MKYEKKPLNCDEHIEILSERGLYIPDLKRAKKYLGTIGYFRLTGYMYHLQESDGSHKFKDGICFNDIILHYHFDKKLRATVNEYLERIEVALRSKLTDYYCINHGFYWFTQYDLYDDKKVYDSINAEIADKFVEPQERFLKYFKRKYTSESLPPSNMAMEILTLGKLSRLYKGLSNDSEKMAIANDFGVPSVILSSWLIYLNNVRNICAHHGRLWNRGITADRPIIPKRKKYKFNGIIPEDFNSSCYGVVSIIDKLLSEINPTNRFIEKVKGLIDQYHNINTKFMGFPENWKEEPSWKKS